MDMRIAVAVAALIASVFSSTPAQAQLPEKTVRMDDMMIDTSRIVRSPSPSSKSKKGPDNPNSAVGFNIYRSQPWPGGVMPIEFAPEVTSNQRTQFMSNCTVWSELANVKCVLRTTEPRDNYLLVTVQNSGCWSTLGKTPQPGLNLAANCWANLTILHELGHSFGLMHEHQRSDRDNFVRINYSNIVPGAENNFGIFTTSVNPGAYDYKSVMHYFSTTFSSGGASVRTIDPVPFDQNVALDMGWGDYRSGFGSVPTATDGEGLVSIYGPSTIVQPPRTYPVRIALSDAVTGDPVRLVTVALNQYSNTGDGVVTTSVPTGTYNVVITAPGYRPIRYDGLHVNAAVSAALPMSPAAVAPTAPVLVATQSNRNPVSLDWSGAPSPGVSGYTVLAGTSPGAFDIAVAPMGMATSITASIPPGTRLYVRVVAENSIGSATSNEVQLYVAPPSAPQPPTLSAAGVSGNAVTLNWAAAHLGDSSFVVLARVTPTGPVIASLPVSGTTTLHVPGVGAGVYYVSVVTASGALSSSESNQIAVTVP